MFMVNLGTSLEHKQNGFNRDTRTVIKCGMDCSEIDYLSDSLKLVQNYHILRMRNSSESYVSISCQTIEQFLLWYKMETVPYRTK